MNIWNEFIIEEEMVMGRRQEERGRDWSVTTTNQVAARIARSLEKLEGVGPVLPVKLNFMPQFD